MAKHILFCNCGGERILSDLLQSIDEHLKKVSVRVTRLSDLCGLVAKKKNLLAGLFVPGTEYMVIGCYRRTMDLLFDQVKEQTVKPASYEHINLLQVSDKEKAIEQITAFCNDSVGTATRYDISEGSGWPSWYPVIDYLRCTACGQCADFCLFGVYEKNESGVQVANPQGCKNNCPACARICPHTAIIFPKYKQGGAIGGSEQIDEIAEQARQTNDIREILGGDIYNALEQRKRRRKSIILQKAMRRAQEERDKAIQESKQ